MSFFPMGEPGETSSVARRRGATLCGCQADCAFIQNQWRPYMLSAEAPTSLVSAQLVAKLARPSLRKALGNRTRLRLHEATGTSIEPSVLRHRPVFACATARSVQSTTLAFTFFEFCDIASQCRHLVLEASLPESTCG